MYSIIRLKLKLASAGFEPPPRAHAFAIIVRRVPLLNQHCLDYPHVLVDPSRTHHIEGVVSSRAIVHDHTYAWSTMVPRRTYGLAASRSNIVGPPRYASSPSDKR